MIRAQWNALKVGDHVLVHDADGDPMALVDGRVTRIDSAAGSNTVEIRLAPANGPSRIVTPSRLAVHHDAGDEAERCWRCDANPSMALRPRSAS